MEAARASVPRGLPGTNIHEWLVKYVIPDALEAAHPAIRADIAAEVLAPIEALVRERMPVETCENFGTPYDCISTGKTLPCFNCRMREDFRAALSTAKEASA